MADLFAAHICASLRLPQRAKGKLGQGVRQGRAAMRRIHQQAWAFQGPHRATHGHGIAVHKTIRIEKPHLPPSFAHTPGDPVRRRILIVLDDDIDQEKPAPVQP